MQSGVGRQGLTSTKLGLKSHWTVGVTWTQLLDSRDLARRAERRARGQDAPEKRSERGGHQDRCPEYVKEKTTCHSLPLKKKKRLLSKIHNLKRRKWQHLLLLVLRTLLRNKRWAVTLLDSVAEVTTCRQSLKDHLVATATSDYIAVETADGRVLPPDRVYDLTIQIEGDVERIISVIFWDELTSDILLAERDWPPEHVRKLPHGEDVFLRSCSGGREKSVCC
ncbi:hypothetical protein NDU88_000959 [Pleurodeles waltl]|uniref:Uncharacterized protein n=1 Tax=Pleurodeles waltl TaxID=8319 RepID=A0AAV7R776_PLEWA|nr:hypothetical protein NDU88_000959 [Pleurodeles waltl]